jgi:hypothetical protein
MASSKNKAEHRPEILSAPWEQSYATYLSGRAVLDGVDALAQEMEAYWGVDRLRLLVPEDLREKFDRQRFKLNSAVMHGELIEVQREGQRMILAWRTLHQEAIVSGAEKLSDEVWETVTDDGTVIAIVRTTAQAHRMAGPRHKTGRRMALYTLDEVARLLVASDAVLRAKLQWPGAEVVRVRRPTDPIKDIPARARHLDDPWEDIDDILRGTPLGRKQEGKR